ncbi:hypothetical protein DNTS_035030 [Danionella cerebrum]|uniref:ENPP1-3/EXOG-like endonuclease/phosphodiesterase domain-containing protein n=1 Tax=Danionella cerebrum TaxID=2873325 RepID=A0A553QZF7_9TELE|nr:hypothetical protein DNTS_035030 [Danionella translucida]
MPLWVSYSFSSTTQNDVRPAADRCVRADVRVATSDRQSCSFYKENSSLTFGLLHPPNLSPLGAEPDSLITSNMVPMFPAFKDIWIHFHSEFLVKYSAKMNGLNVVSGPIFDQDFDGHYDIMEKGTLNEAPIPTHFYVILTNCKNQTLPLLQCDGPLEAVSFILPHRPDHQETCHNGTDFSWLTDWLKLHVARIRDIELLTVAEIPNYSPVSNFSAH